jgi:hypothetical protein
MISSKEYGYSTDSSLEVDEVFEDDSPQNLSKAKPLSEGDKPVPVPTPFEGKKFASDPKNQNNINNNLNTNLSDETKKIAQPGAPQKKRTDTDDRYIEPVVKPQLKRLTSIVGKSATTTGDGEVEHAAAAAAGGGKMLNEIPVDEDTQDVSGKMCRMHSCGRQENSASVQRNLNNMRRKLVGEFNECDQVGSSEDQLELCSSAVQGYFTPTSATGKVFPPHAPKRKHAFPRVAPSARRSFQTMQRTQHPYYANYHERMDSFTAWPKQIIQSSDEMASAGFFYTRVGDAVMCFHCGQLLQQWEVNDIPLVEHQHFSPRCEFVNSVW